MWCKPASRRRRMHIGAVMGMEGGDFESDAIIAPGVYHAVCAVCVNKNQFRDYLRHNSGHNSGSGKLRHYIVNTHSPTFAAWRMGLRHIVMLLCDVLLTYNTTELPSSTFDGDEQFIATLSLRIVLRTLRILPF